MDVHKTSLLEIFDSKQRLEVPLFQRQYVWKEDDQWLPLWEDIERKFSETLLGHHDGPVHFLGAMVLDQKQTPTGHVVRRQIIDGQQRLTTLQIFLSAFRDFCRVNGCDELANESDKFILNTGIMTDPDVDRFKIWPTQLDRNQFVDVITSGSREELERRHPRIRRKYQRKFDPRPRMIEAYVFFYDCLRQFFIGEDQETPLANEYPLAHRLDEAFTTLKSALMVVVIDLSADDDPQVIFETLNARGEPLLPADLLRNYVFLRAARDGFDTEDLYNEYWQGFDDEFWREEVKQGRLRRPRSDLFMQHFLASRQGRDIPIKHLYVEYRHWIERQSPFESVDQELATIARQGEHFRRILDPAEDDPLFGISRFLHAFDVRTAYPLLLALLEVNISPDEWGAISRDLESFIVRRAFCRLVTKNYNRIFLAAAKSMHSAETPSANLRNQLLGQSGASVRWPSNSEFQEAWLKAPAYDILRSSRLVHILKRLNETFTSSKNETLSFETEPTIEHIMPQKWEDNWPLPDGSKGLNWFELLEADSDDPVSSQSRQREALVDTIGNLTIITRGLNAAQSNLAWKAKRPELMRHSLLPINQVLASRESWDEQAIEARSQSLFERAIQVWPR